MDELTIELNNVALDMGTRRVLSKINHTFTPHKTTVILGSSGSGKSMLLKVAAGLIPPSEGSVTVNGLNLLSISEAQEREFRKQSGFVFQDGALWANRTVLQNVLFPLEVHFFTIKEEERRRIAEEQLQKVGYEDSIEHRPSQISTGEQKMVSLARSLVTQPELLFLDNPLVSLDSGSAEQMVKLIKQLHKNQITLIGSFASAELISLIADELILLHKGEVLVSGPFREVRQTEDPVAKGILAVLFNEAASFDDDILELINDDDLIS